MRCGTTHQLRGPRSGSDGLCANYASVARLPSKQRRRRQPFSFSVGAADASTDRYKRVRCARNLLTLVHLSELHSLQSEGGRIDRRAERR